MNSDATPVRRPSRHRPAGAPHTPSPADDTSRDPILVRASSRSLAGDSRSGAARRILDDFKRGKGLGLTRLSLRASRRTEPFPASNSRNDATLLVQSGGLQVHVGDYHCFLGPGDSLRFPLRRGYRLQCGASEGCEAFLLESRGAEAG